MKDYVLGLDIGGTKTGVGLGTIGGELLATAMFPTDPVHGAEDVIYRAANVMDRLLRERDLTHEDVEAVGIACGGPLDRASGRLFSPPNLTGWGEVPIVRLVEERLGVKAYLDNDANACALAEWKFGAAKGLENVVFLTFGTGLGAGLILDGRLYRGTSDLAGEVGHIRLAEDGPLGYGKRGSFEGFCSGSGLVNLAVRVISDSVQDGHGLASWATVQKVEQLTAKVIAEAALAGDDVARRIMSISGKYLGRGVALLIDLLNPEAIVIGSIFARAEALLRPAMEKEIEAEALNLAASKCKVVPALLGEELGYYASIAVAMEALGVL